MQRPHISDASVGPWHAWLAIRPTEQENQQASRRLRFWTANQPFTSKMPRKGSLNKIARCGSNSARVSSRCGAANIPRRRESGIERRESSGQHQRPSHPTKTGAANASPTQALLGSISQPVLGQKSGSRWTSLRVDRPLSQKQNNDLTLEGR